jgi:uncharacterized protein YndB with AHSA1/START domain
MPHMKRLLVRSPLAAPQTEPFTADGGHKTGAAPVLRHRVVVGGTPEQAFAAFTERMGDIKPKEHNLLGSPIVTTTFEPRVGGHIVDRAEDGSECRWARVLAYEPPDRLVFSWDIGPTWQLELDPRQCQ